MLPDTLSIREYTTVLHALSATFTCTGCALLFIVLTQHLLHRTYHLSMALCATLLLAATYHNYELICNWKNAYMYADGAYIVTQIPFIDTYRYIDWLCTLPLLLTAFICLFQETKHLSSLLIRLSAATLAMTALGYTSELCWQPSNRLISFIGANFFLCYVLYTLSFELKPIIKREFKTILPFIQITRICLVLSWPIYPIVSLIKTSSSIQKTIIQIIYCLTDIIALVVPVLLCFLVAYQQSQQIDRNNLDEHP